MTIIEKANQNYNLCRIPGIVATNKKSLLAYYEGRNSSSDWAEIDLKVIKSTDKGETWKTVLIIPSEGNTVNNPVMIVDGDTIHFLYCKNYKEIFYCKSEDDGESFSEVIDISKAAEGLGHFYNVVAIGPGHGIVHNGTILIPLWFAYNEEDAKSHFPSMISTLYSDDGGKTWNVGEIIGRDVLKNPSECALAVTSNGDVLISIRNENECRQRAVAYSKTGYSGWFDLTFREDLPDPICQGSLCHTGDTIVHINCADKTKRENLCLKISKDDFKTFKEVLVDEQGGYSDIAIIDDDICIIYESNIFATGFLCYKTIKL